MAAENHLIGWIEKAKVELFDALRGRCFPQSSLWLPDLAVLAWIR